MFTEADMKPHIKVALIAAALTLGAGTAAMAGPQYGPDYTPAPPPHGKGHAKGHQHAKAYGFHCKGFSKKHVKGQKGTPFSQCVKAMAQAHKHERMAPGRACKALSKKHVKGKKGTPFSRCVKEVAQMRKEQQDLATASAV
jgi:hypothetical protein